MAPPMTPQELSEAIQQLDKQLHEEVVSHHEELLQQLSSLKDTEGVLAVVRAGVESLQASVLRVRTEIADPYRLIKAKTRQLAALHETMEYLRAVIKFMKLVRKLREMMDSETKKTELAKAAQLYHDIETLHAECDLRGIDVVAEEMPWVQKAGEEVRKEAMKLLEAGMEALNQSEVGSVLQVYFNMGELRATVELLVSKYKAQASSAISTGLDMRAISASANLAAGQSLMGGGPGGASRSGTPQVGRASKAKDALWQRLGTCFEQVHGIVLATWHLQRMLAKKRDPISHVMFLDEVVQQGDPTPMDKLWESVCRSFTAQLRAAFTASSFVKETFVLGFPRLVHQLEAFLDRLARETDVKGMPSACRPEDRAHMMTALEPFQAAYLAQSLSRLTDLVNMMLPAGTARAVLPGAEQGALVVERLREELGAVKGDVRLTLLVLHGSGKALQLLAERAEYQLMTGPDARQVGGPATAAQRRNGALCVLLQEVHGRTTALLEEYPEEVDEVLGPGLKAVLNVALDSVSPLFKAMGDRIESLILQIHDDDFGEAAHSAAMRGAPPASDPTRESPGDGCSPYMEGTIRAIRHFHSEFLGKLQLLPPAAPAAPSGAPGALPTAPHLQSYGSAPGSQSEPLCLGLTKRMAARILTFFVRHAALVRPLSEEGKLRIARDIGELEFAVSQHLFPAERLGPAYRALRALRPLLFLDTNAIPTSSLLSDLPPSVVLYHLFSRAPRELKSPWERSNLTPAKYSLWLDQHSEEDAWRGMQGALEAYAGEVRARGGKEFSPIYPLLLSLGQSLFEGGPNAKGKEGS